MPGGNVRKIVILAFAALMAGCASLPPTIDQGEYQNYRYGFIVRLPEGGWQMTKTVPDGFADYLVPEVSEKVELLLHNPQTRGLIAVRGGSLYLSYESALTFQERLTEMIEPVLDVDWALLVRDVPESRGSYRLGHWDASGLQWQERSGSSPLDGIRHTSMGYYYPLNGEPSYDTFYLFSEPDTFDRNVKVLQRMAGTFSSGEVFTSRGYGW
jgi:hypothetical protein